MHLPKFEYFRPSTVGGATRFLKEYGPQARVAAGGTDLFPRMKYGLDHPEVIVSLKGIPVKSPTESHDGTLHIDALMVLSEVFHSPVVLDKAPMLAKAAECVASGEIRNVGTLGGNICQESRCLYYNQSHSYQFVEPCFKRGGSLCYFVPKGKKCLAVYMADTAPALMCLNSEIKIIGPEGERVMPIGEFYSGDAKRPLNIGPDEILVKVIIPPQPATSGWAYKKVSQRGGLEFAAVNVAVVLQMAEEEEICKHARIALGAIGFLPFRALMAETHLIGKEASDNLFAEAARLVSDEIKMIPHHGYSTKHLRETLKIQTKRALKTAYMRVRP